MSVYDLLSATRAIYESRAHNSAAHALVQAEIKNAFHANNFQYWYDPDVTPASWMCAYCGGARSTSLWQCPGCGAPRTNTDARI